VMRATNDPVSSFLDIAICCLREGSRRDNNMKLRRSGRPPNRAFPDHGTRGLPELPRDAERLQLSIKPQPGDQVQDLVQRMYATPREIVVRTKRLSAIASSGPLRRLQRATALGYFVATSGLS
jgi:hypothetical protein